MSDKPKRSVFLVSKQGNSNLVMQSGDIEFSDTLAEAREDAASYAKEDRTPWFVFEVQVSPLFVYRPQVSVTESEIIR